MTITLSSEQQERLTGLALRAYQFADDLGAEMPVELRFDRACTAAFIEVVKGEEGRTLVFTMPAPSDIAIQL